MVGYPGIDFIYKDIKVTITAKPQVLELSLFDQQRQKYIAENDDPHNPVVREVLLIATLYLMEYSEKGSFPDFEDAMLFAAFMLMPEKVFFKNKKILTPQELAKAAEVTEEFAQYRINLYQQKQNMLNSGLEGRL